MSTQPQRPGKTEDFTEAELKRIYDEHVPAEKEGTVSREELLREGLRKLKQLTPKWSRLRITALAKTEIDSAASWFERRKEGLGIEFYQRVDEAAEKIERNPEGFQKIYKDMRHVNLEQFKERGLFFRIKDDGQLWSPVWAENATLR